MKQEGYANVETFSLSYIAMHADKLASGMSCRMYLNALHARLNISNTLPTLHVHRSPFRLNHI